MDSSSDSDMEIENENPTFDFTKKSWKDDVTFVIDEQRLYASKSVLAISSPVFESMFGSDFKEKVLTEVPLPGKKFAEFLQFLHCLYSKSSNCITAKNALTLLPLFDEYQVKSLKKECDRRLQMNLQENDLNVHQLLDYYNVASRHGLSDIKQLVMEELLHTNESKDILNEAKSTIDPTLLHEFKDDIIAVQEKSLQNFTTKFVKQTFMPSRNITGYENARGAVIEHQIVNVLDPNLQKGVESKRVKLWNAQFSVNASVRQKTEKGQSEKYLSVYLNCNLPEDGWYCEVTAEIVLENVFSVQNTVLTRKTILNRVYTTDSESYGFPTLEKLSKFLTDTPKNVENYSGKVTAYILAEKPTFHDPLF